MGFWGFVNNVKSGISNIGSNIQSAASNAYDYLNSTKAGNVISKLTVDPIINGIPAAAEGLSTLYDKATNTQEANQAIDNIQSPVGMANTATGAVGSLIENISGQEAKRQYEQTRNDALSQYQEQFDYLKEENELARQRADTALQRQMQDALAAGLSPLSTSIQGADIGGQGGSIQGQTATPTSTGGMGALGSVLGMLNPILGAVVSRQNALTQAETSENNAKIQAETQKAIAEMNSNALKEIAGARQQGENEERPSRIKVNEATAEEKKANTRLTESKTETEDYERQWNEEREISKNTSEKEKLGSGVMKKVMDIAEKLNTMNNNEEGKQKWETDVALADWNKEKMPKEIRNQFDKYWQQWNANAKLKQTYGTWESYIKALKREIKEKARTQYIESSIQGPKNSYMGM